MVKCTKCGKDLDGKDRGVRLASISGSIMGDEYIESYYFCNQCEFYTLEIYHDRFLGDEDVFIRGPLEKQEGDAKVELIGKCSEPWNKKCRCNAHRTYFDGNLD